MMIMFDVHCVYCGSQALTGHLASGQQRWDEEHLACTAHWCARIHVRARCKHPICVCWLEFVRLLLLCPRRILSPTLEELKQLQLEQKTGAAADAAAGVEQGRHQQQLQQQQQQQRVQFNNRPTTCSDQPPVDPAVAAATPTWDGAAAAAAAAAAVAAAAEGEGTCFSPSLQAATAPRAAMSAVFAPLSAAHVAYRQRLHEQERRSARIKLLLRKDFLHRMLFTGYVYGTRWSRLQQLLADSNGAATRLHSHLL
jgi:hypothetical protein